MSKPRVLVLGGLGFIGRHLVKYLVDKDLASKIRVVDKTILAMARLGKDFTDVFNKVETIQANLINKDSAAKAFTDPEGDYQIVINLAGETKLSQEDTVYAEGITKLSTVVAEEALKHKTEKYIEVSSAEVYEPSSNAAKETTNTKPWNGIGKAKLKAEENLKALKGLPLIIVRPAIVYGPGDVRGLAPRFCMAAVYKKSGEKMEYPDWFEKTKINTVHVRDVARALWHLASNGTAGQVFNLADKNNTDQVKLNVIIEKLFGIKTGHLGTIKSEAIKLLTTENLVEEINSELIPTWVKMTNEAKLDYSPLSPYLEVEALSNKSLCVDGSAVESTGFAFEVPTIGEAEVKEQLKHAVSEGWFPPNLVEL